MRVTLFFLLAGLCLPGTASLAQDSLKILVSQGIALHDKGDYEGAIKAYDEVIQRDKNYFEAYYEKSFSLYKWGKYEACADWCKTSLSISTEEKQNKNLYVNYGSALDALKKPDEAIKIYSEGIKKYPGFYLLVFNRGITEYFEKNYDDAVADFEKSVSLNPVHASSHQFLAYCIYRKNKMAAVLSLTTFLLLEPEGTRAEKNHKVLMEVLGSNVEKKDDKNVTISLSADALKKDKNREDDFGMAEMMISMTAALDYDDKFKDQPPAEKLKRKLEAFVSTTTEDKKSKKKGFFMNFYVPFLAEMKEKDLLLTACYIMGTPAADEEGKKWLDANKNKVEDFYKWMDTYKWQKD